MYKTLKVYAYIIYFALILYLWKRRKNWYLSMQKPFALHPRTHTNRNSDDKRDNFLRAGQYFASRHSQKHPHLEVKRRREVFCLRSIAIGAPC